MKNYREILGTAGLAAALVLAGNAGLGAVQGAHAESVATTKVVAAQPAAATAATTPEQFYGNDEGTYYSSTVLVKVGPGGPGVQTSGSIVATGSPKVSTGDAGQIVLTRTTRPGTKIGACIVEEDESLAKLGIMAGCSGGSGTSNIYMYDAKGLVKPTDSRLGNNAQLWVHFDDFVPGKVQAPPAAAPAPATPTGPEQYYGNDQGTFYTTTTIVRLGEKPYIHTNSAHASTGHAKVSKGASNQVVVTREVRKGTKIAACIVDEDETLSKLGIQAGCSGGSGTSNIYLYDRNGKQVKPDDPRFKNRANLWIHWDDFVPATGK